MPFTAGRDGAWESDDTTPVFVISVAAELTGLHAQTLRQYDRLGLVSPGRTPGGGRRYSRHDIARAARGVRLSGLGLGLEGVRQVLELENHVAALQARVARARGRAGLLSGARPPYRPRRLAPRHHPPYTTRRWTRRCGTRDRWTPTS